MATVNKTLETSYGQFVVEKVDDVLTLSEDYIDKYLPDSEEEAEGTGKSSVQSNYLQLVECLLHKLEIMASKPDWL